MRGGKKYFNVASPEAKEQHGRRPRLHRTERQRSRAAIARCSRSPALRAREGRRCFGGELRASRSGQGRAGCGQPCVLSPRLAAPSALSAGPRCLAPLTRPGTKPRVPRRLRWRLSHLRGAPQLRPPACAPKNARYGGCYNVLKHPLGAVGFCVAVRVVVCHTLAARWPPTEGCGFASDLATQK